MSERPPEPVPERRRRRLEADLRRAHVIASEVVAQHPGAEFGSPRWCGWSPAEALLHLVLVSERVLDGLRVAATAPALTTPVGQDFGQWWARRTAEWTFHLKDGPSTLDGTAPGGVLLPPEVLLKRHAVVTAAYLDFVAREPGPLLDRVRFRHPEFGPMDAFAWGRYLLVLARHVALGLDLGRPRG